MFETDGMKDAAIMNGFIGEWGKAWLSHGAWFVSGDAIRNLSGIDGGKVSDDANGLCYYEG